MRMNGSAGSTAGEFAFHCREDTLDHGAAAAEFTREVLAHLTEPPVARRLVNRLGGITLLASNCLPQKVWLRSESNSASASTQPTGVCSWAYPNQRRHREPKCMGCQLLAVPVKKLFWSCGDPIPPIPQEKSPHVTNVTDFSVIIRAPSPQ